MTWLWVMLSINALLMMIYLIAQKVTIKEDVN